MPDSDPQETRLKELRERWDDDPDSRIYLLLAEEYRKLGRLAEAADVLEQGLKRRPRDLSATVALGRCRLELGEFDAAIPLLHSVIERDPAHIVANKLLVEAYLRTADPDSAGQRLEIYRLLNDRDPELEHLEYRWRRLQSEARVGEARTSDSAPLPVEVALPPLPVISAAPALAPPEIAPPEIAPPEIAPPEIAPPEIAPPQIAPPAAGVIFAFDPWTPPRPNLDSLWAQVGPPAQDRALSSPGLAEPEIALPSAPEPEPAHLAGSDWRAASAWENTGWEPAWEPAAEEAVADAQAGEVSAEDDFAKSQEDTKPMPKVVTTPEAELAPEESAAWFSESAAGYELTQPLVVADQADLLPPAAEPAVGQYSLTAEEVTKPLLALQTAAPELAELLPLQLGEEDTRPTAARPWSEPEPFAEPAAPEIPWPDLAPASGWVVASVAEEPDANEPGETEPGETELEETEIATATLGELYLGQGYLDEAQRIFEQVLHRDPGNHPALTGLRKVMRRVHGKLTAAELLLERTAGSTRAPGLTAKKILVLESYLQQIRGVGQTHVQ